MKKSILEKFFSTPSEILEKSVELEKEFTDELKEEKPIKSINRYWNILGPGLITGAADDDPSGIATYSQMGASQGFGLIWISLFSYPLMAVVQEMCARIGLTTGMGLSSNIRKFYSQKVLYLCIFLLLLANIFNIAADLGAMAKGIQLLLPNISFTFFILLFAVLSLFLQIFVSYKQYSKYLKYLTFVLFAYIISALSLHMDWGVILKNTLIPHFYFSKSNLILLCAALGTTISPYLFFWQSSQEVEEQILRGEKTVEIRQSKNTKRDVKDMRIDVWSGMFVSNLVMFFVIASCAMTLYANGITNIDSASDAAIALRPFAGDFAYALFALGILGTGLLAIPVLAGSASYAISEAFGWKSGLYRKLKQAPSFYGVIIFSMFMGLILNFIGLNPIKMLIYSAVLNGVISPFMIFFIIKLSSNPLAMGDFVNKKSTNILGWFTFLVISMVGLGAIISILI